MKRAAVLSCLMSEGVPQDTPPHPLMLHPQICHPLNGGGGMVHTVPLSQRVQSSMSSEQIYLSNLVEKGLPETDTKNLRGSSLHKVSYY